MNFDVILKVFLKWIKIFYKFVIISVILVVIVTFLVPRRYIIKASLIPYRTKIVGEGEVLPAEYIRLMEGLPKGFGGIITPSDILSAFAKNRDVIEPVIKKLNLMDTFRVGDIEQALSKFEEFYKVKTGPEGMVNLIFLYSHPQTGIKILNKVIENLDNFIRKIYTQFYEQRMKLLNERFTEIKNELTAVEDSFRFMQEKYKVHSLEGDYGEYRFIFENYAQLKKEEIEAEIYYKTLLSTIGDTLNIEVKRAKKKWKELKKKLREIEKGGKSKGYGAGFGLPLEKVPEASITLMRLWRRQRVLSDLYSLILEELEKTRIEASKSIPFFSVVSEPDYKKREKVPKRSVVLVGGLILSLFFSILIIYVMEFIDRLQKDENMKSLRDFFETISSDFKRTKT